MSNPAKIREKTKKIFIITRSLLDKIKQESSKFNETLVKEYMNSNVEAYWRKFKNLTSIAMEKRIPSKATNTRHNLPWLHIIVMNTHK